MFWMFATLIILGLGLYAAWMWMQVYKREMARDDFLGNRYEAVLKGLDVIGRSMVEEQVNVTEAALRLSTLLDNLARQPEPSVDLEPIYRLAREAQPLAIGAQRDALDPAERERQDEFREKLEREHGEAAITAARQLLAVLPYWRKAEPTLTSEEISS